MAKNKIIKNSSSKTAINAEEKIEVAKVEKAATINAGNKMVLSNGKFVLSGGKFVANGSSGPTPVYPTKGQLITMNLGNETPAAGTNNQYRVLSINGSVAEVVAMYEMPDIEFSLAEENTYFGGNLDSYLEDTFYESLSTTAKAAIVAKDITQYQYTRNTSVYDETTHASYADYSTKDVKADDNRSVYALDVEDIENYFNSTFSTANIWTLFWNTSVAPSTASYPWLRSADADNITYAWNIYGNTGAVSRRTINSARAVRPALTIDLSKISWS